MLLRGHQEQRGWGGRRTERGVKLEESAQQGSPIGQGVLGTGFLAGFGGGGGDPAQCGAGVEGMEMNRLLARVAFLADLYRDGIGSIPLNTAFGPC